MIFSKKRIKDEISVGIGKCVLKSEIPNYPSPKEQIPDGRQTEQISLSETSNAQNRTRKTARTPDAGHLRAMEADFSPGQVRRDQPDKEGNRRITSPKDCA